MYSEKNIGTGKIKVNIRKIAGIIICILVFNAITAFAEININEDIKAALVGDVETGEILYGYNTKETVEIASITKLMTYLTARDAIDNKNLSLEDMVTISKKAAETNGSSFDLVQGDKIELETLLNSILIVSGNDAAVAIAEHVAGSEEEFVRMMNEKAVEIGINSARFINPNGMPVDEEETDQNYMSSEDIFILARHILTKYPDITEITSKHELIIPEKNYQKEATNPLLTQMKGVDGLKTGYTHKAGLCLVSTISDTDPENTKKDRRVVSVLMGAYSHRDREEKSKKLLEYGMYNFSKEKLITESEILEEIVISNAKEVIVPVAAQKDCYKLLKNGTEVRKEIEYKEELKAPLKKDDVVGILKIYADNKLIEETPVVAGKDVEKAGFVTMAFRYFRNVFGL